LGDETPLGPVARSRDGAASQLPVARPDETTASTRDQPDIKAAIAQSEATPGAYVAIDPVYLRSEPTIEAARVGELAEGDRVNVLRQLGSWSEIRLPDGRQVFVSSLFLAPAP
jgi:uncharacterized protein YgiM (DUF1202 family)